MATDTMMHPRLATWVVRAHSGKFVIFQVIRNGRPSKPSRLGSQPFSERGARRRLSHAGGSACLMSSQQREVFSCT